MGFFLAASCGDLGIRRGDSSPGTRTLRLEDATISDDSAVSVGETEIALAATGSTGIYDSCTYTGSNAATTSADWDLIDPGIPQLNNSTHRQAYTFTLTSYLEIKTVILRLYKEGAPTGDLNVDVMATSGGVPTGVALGTSATVTYASVSADGVAPHGATYSLTYTSPVALSAGDYALVARPSNLVAGALNFVVWQITASAAGCSGKSVPITSTNSGSSFASTAARRNFVSIMGQTHAPTADLSWITSGFTNATWDLSTFDVTETLYSTSGTVLYDVGAGESPTTATYSLTGKTKAEVQAAADFSGTYFYIKATLAVPTPFFETVSIGEITIDAL